MDRASRAARLADQIRDYLAVWLNRDYPGSLISVSSVQLSVSKQHATVWLFFVIPGTQNLLPQIVKKQPYYQSQLRQSLNRAAVPMIHFQSELEESK